MVSEMTSEPDPFPRQTKIAFYGSIAVAAVIAVGLIYFLAV
jgi:hypothetical protein